MSALWTSRGSRLRGWLTIVVALLVLGVPAAALGSPVAHASKHKHHSTAKKCPTQPKKHRKRPPTSLCFTHHSRHQTNTTPPGPAATELGGSVGSYPNGAIADYGLARVGHWAGQCKQAVNDWVAAVSGGSQRLGGDYRDNYRAQGGTEVSRDQTVKGDIIQLDNDRDQYHYYKYMHTAVVVSHTPGSNQFDVVDSNYSTNEDELVRHHVFNPYAQAALTGVAVHFWRMGTVQAPPPPPPPPTPAGAYGRSLAVVAGKGYSLDDFGTLHALGGAPDAGDQSGHKWNWDIARSVALRPDGHTGYVLDGWGALHPFGGAPDVGDQSTHYWKGWDIARSAVSTPDGNGGYILDGWGGLHTWGNAPALANSAYWKGWDIARSFALAPGGKGGYLLDGWGGIHPVGAAPAEAGTGYWKGWDIARSIAVRPDGKSGYVLDGFGGVHPFGNAPAVGIARYDGGKDDAVSIALTTAGNGGWVLFKDGEVSPFGNAPPMAGGTSFDSASHQGGPQ